MERYSVRRLSGHLPGPSSPRDHESLLICQGIHDARKKHPHGIADPEKYGPDDCRTSAKRSPLQTSMHLERSRHDRHTIARRSPLKKTGGNWNMLGRRVWAFHVIWHAWSLECGMCCFICKFAVAIVWRWCGNRVAVEQYRAGAINCSTKIDRGFSTYRNIKKIRENT